MLHPPSLSTALASGRLGVSEAKDMSPPEATTRRPWAFEPSVPWELDVQQVISVPLVGRIRLHLNLFPELPQLLVRHETRL